MSNTLHKRTPNDQTDRATNGFCCTHTERPRRAALRHLSTRSHCSSKGISHTLLPFLPVRRRANGRLRRRRSFRQLNGNMHTAQRAYFFLLIALNLVVCSQADRKMHANANSNDHRNPPVTCLHSRQCSLGTQLLTLLAFVVDAVRCRCHEWLMSRS